MELLKSVLPARRNQEPFQTIVDCLATVVEELRNKEGKGFSSLSNTMNSIVIAQ